MQREIRVKVAERLEEREKRGNAGRNGSGKTVVNRKVGKWR